MALAHGQEDSLSWLGETLAGLGGRTCACDGHVLEVRVHVLQLLYLWYTCEGMRGNDCAKEVMRYHTIHHRPDRAV